MTKEEAIATVDVALYEIEYWLLRGSMPKVDPASAEAASLVAKHCDEVNSMSNGVIDVEKVSSAFSVLEHDQPIGLPKMCCGGFYIKKSVNHG